MATPESQEALESELRDAKKERQMLASLRRKEKKLRIIKNNSSKSEVKEKNSIEKLEEDLNKDRVKNEAEVKVDSGSSSEEVSRVEISPFSRR